MYRSITNRLAVWALLATLLVNFNSQNASGQAPGGELPPVAAQLDSLEGQSGEGVGNSPGSIEAGTHPDLLEAETDEYLKSPNSAPHNAWMLVCCALVLFMTAPGLAMFYGGLVRKKNVLSVLMQCIFLMGMMSVVWALYGYSLAFGSGGPYIGNLDYALMHGVARQWSETLHHPVTPMFDEALPRLTHMMFQGMFFIITPALICGAFAERMKFGAMVLFSLVWGTVVYCPLAHWVWGGGILAFGGESSIAGGALDFAGGTVVHISSGVTALVAAIVIGPRIGHGREPMPPHNLTYTALGAAMLWVGWFGFNAGSALRIDGIAASAFAVTHFSAAAGAVTWALIEWLRSGKPTVLGASSGAVAGLVCITPAAGHVGPMASLIMGALGGVVCYLSCSKLKSKFRYDDSLDAFGIHGMGGALGAVLTGVFATRAVLDISGGEPVGMIEGNYSTILGQLAATGITIAYAAIVSFGLLKLLDLTIGLRVSATSERQGLDITEHGEEGHIFL
ncbi:ammonium transporter [Aureliella helgolandensis]|uniref:Ammonium transporter n=1 Tax=Aureliella helgolandensis TaxID=2527968 RepID=A0A518G0I3_9BACT|nr:ammonium transporter [Aureliella helgolandensis]QDV22111.1 Ammonium transporter NrgA [Aureliella helgolandensis]